MICGDDTEGNSLWLCPHFLQEEAIPGFGHTAAFGPGTENMWLRRWAPLGACHQGQS